VTKRSAAECLIAAFGGVIKAANSLNKCPTEVSRLKRSKDKGGCGGDVPRSWQKAALQIAKERGLDLTAEDLILGRESGNATIQAIGISLIIGAILAANAVLLFCPEVLL